MASVTNLIVLLLLCLAGSLLICVSSSEQAFVSHDLHGAQLREDTRIDDLDDEEGGDEEKGNNESEKEDDDEKEGDKESESAKGQDDKEDDDMDDNVVDEEEGGDEKGEEEDDDEEKVYSVEDNHDDVGEEEDDDVKERIVQHNDDEVVEDEVIDMDEEVRDEVVTIKENEEVVMNENVVENIPDDVVDCGNDDKEVKNTDENKENEEVFMDENVVENIPDDVVDCGNDDKEVKTTYENKGVLQMIMTWLMEHGGYKQEDTKAWGLEKLKEEMNKVEIELAMYANKQLEETKKEYTWPSLNRMGDERLLKELDNLKKLVGEETDTKKDENDVSKLLSSVPFLQSGHPTKKDDINQEKRIKMLSQASKSPYVNRKVAMGEKITTTKTLVTNYIFKDTDTSK
ncbi:hypothetical protein L1987_14695 [Smallanthus sonchifolius]|uniref:Uncharacterized protein n=1 Tax=Smallanthus sonchifolius TaxID=185202 RepID=A0ACB9J5T6_9ASTR|nr:hypothetical protein L1987_14695 [Smallanthus sonchifolius]